MNQDKKTSSFLKAINKYAQQQSEAIKLEVEEFKKKEIKKATDEGISDAYKLIQKEIATKKSQIISESARLEQESRNKLFIRRNEIVESVFADAKAQLLEFTDTDDYIGYIKKSVAEMAEYFKDNEFTVYIKESDCSKKSEIQSVASINIEVDNSIEIGGIKGFCEKLSILIDDTFDSKLEDERVWFAENSGLKVV